MLQTRYTEFHGRRHDRGHPARSSLGPWALSARGLREPCRFAALRAHPGEVLSESASLDSSPDRGLSPLAAAPRDRALVGWPGAPGSPGCLLGRALGGPAGCDLRVGRAAGDRPGDDRGGSRPARGGPFPGIGPARPGGKLGLYARSGVRKYWIVEPGERQIELLVNESGRFMVALPSRTHYQSQAMDEVRLELAELWLQVDDVLTGAPRKGAPSPHQPPGISLSFHVFSRNSGVVWGLWLL